MDGLRPGTVPGQYAGGVGEDGVQALREFVSQGGTLVTLGNAGMFAIEVLGYIIITRRFPVLPRDEAAAAH